MKLRNSVNLFWNYSRICKYFLHVDPNFTLLNILHVCITLFIYKIDIPITTC